MSMGSWMISFSREGAPSPSRDSACAFLAFFRSFLLLERLALNSDSAMMASGGVGCSGVCSRGSLSSASASSKGVRVASSSQLKRSDALDFFLPFLFFDCTMSESWGSSASEISLLRANGVGSEAPVDVGCCLRVVSVVLSRKSLSTSSASIVGSSTGIGAELSFQLKAVSFLDFFLPFLFFVCTMSEAWGTSASEISLLPANGVGSAAPVDASCSLCRVSVVLSRTCLSSSSASMVGSSPGIGARSSVQLVALSFINFFLPFLFLGIVIPFSRESTASDMSLLLSDGAEPVRPGFSKDSLPTMSAVVVSAFSLGVSAPESRSYPTASSTKPKALRFLAFLFSFLVLACGMPCSWGSSTSDTSLLSADGVACPGPLGSTTLFCRVSPALVGKDVFETSAICSASCDGSTVVKSGPRSSW